MTYIGEKGKQLERQPQTKNSTANATSPASGLLQRACACGQRTNGGGCSACEKEQLQRSTRKSELGTRNSGDVPPIVHEVLRSPGQPLDATTRAFFEPRFGHDFTEIPTQRAFRHTVQSNLIVGRPDDTFEQEADRMSARFNEGPASIAFSHRSRLGRIDFSQVRVHTDAQAAESAKAVNALAYTVGSDIVFGPGTYAPGTAVGRRLLAHELTHVLQQTASGSGIVQRAEVDDNPAFCFPASGAAALVDAGPSVNSWIAAARSTAEARALHIVNAVYEELGSGGVRGRSEQRLAALPATIVRHVAPADSRFRHQQYLPTPAAQARTRRLAPVLNLCGVCVGTDKLGHFFQQGYEYFRLGQLLRQRIRNMSREERENFERQIRTPLPDLPFSLPPSQPTFEFPQEFLEDQLVDSYTHEFGKWLEGFQNRLPQAEVRWIKSQDFIPWYYHEGVYGRTLSGVLSRADLAANRGGARFYIDLWRDPNRNPDICNYVTNDWNERNNLSTFVDLPLPSGRRSTSEIAEEP